MRLATGGSGWGLATVVALAAAGCGDDGLTSPELPGPEVLGELTLAFVSNRDGNDEIYGLDPGGAAVRLTADPANDRGPVWSPDGRRLAFTRQIGQARDVMVLDLGTGRVDNVSGAPAADDRDPTWSPDGTRLAFTSDRTGDDDLFVVRADGTGLQNLTRHPAPDREPMWSPDGARIAFTSARDLRAAIYSIGADGTGLKRLTSGRDADDRAPRWAPSGSTLVFESSRDGRSALVRFDPDSGVQTELAAHPAHDVGARWSPDGRTIAFLSNRLDALWDVWTVDENGGGARKVSGAGSDRDARPAWSPDGRELAFESRRTGNWDLFVVGSDGTGLRPLVSHPANDGAAAWRPER